MQLLKQHKKQKTSLSKLTLLSRVVSVFLLLLVSLPTGRVNRVEAAETTVRSVTVGTSVASAVTTHEFRFTTATSGGLASVKFEYCDNGPIYGSPCNPPPGLVVNTATIDAQSGITGLSVSAPDSTANLLVLTRTSGFISGATPVVIRVGNVTNNSAPNDSVFVRVSTHATSDGSGVEIDEGSVAFYTVTGVGVGGYVPPFLIFCVGVTVDPSCGSTAGSLISLGELSENGPTVATSQFAVSTNDPTGYNLFMSGGTMTSGNEIIPALSSNSGSLTGTSQFGINLRQNSSPLVGANVTGIGTGNPSSGYNGSNSFRYNNGERIAGSTLPTDFNRFTVSYLVNIASGQAPGVYASSYTFTAVASF